MNYFDYQTYCKPETVNELVKLGYKRLPEDKVADPNQVPLEEARTFLMRAYNSVYYRIWNNDEAKFEYKVTFLDDPDIVLEGKGFDKAQDALQDAIDAIIDILNK